MSNLEIKYPEKSSKYSQKQCAARLSAITMEIEPYSLYDLFSNVTSIPSVSSFCKSFISGSSTFERPYSFEKLLWHKIAKFITSKDARYLGSMFPRRNSLAPSLFFLFIKNIAWIWNSRKKKESCRNVQSADYAD